MRTCVIFNPAAKGEKARRFHAGLDAIGKECGLKKTTAPGDARRLAAQAIAEGYELVVAAGGDGTLNEVLNGMGDAPDGFQRACLGVLPLGTINVFARELKIPLSPDAAMAALRHGREIRVDLPQAQFEVNGKRERRFFAQLAGAGLDACAIGLVSWRLKKSIGPLAYVVAGLRAVTHRRPLIRVWPGTAGIESSSSSFSSSSSKTPLFRGRERERGRGRSWKASDSGQTALTASNATTSLAGELILIGNGRLYGGDYQVQPHADLQNGRLDVCVFPRAGWWTLVRYGVPLVLRGRLPERGLRRFAGTDFTLTSDSAAAFELDGELVGQLPVKFSIAPAGLRVWVPGAS